MVLSVLLHLTLALQGLPSAALPAAALPRPTLSAAAARGLYYEGERVALRCSAPTRRALGGFGFFNRSGAQVYQRAPYNHSTAWLQLTAAKAAAGDYTCVYWVVEAGRELYSNRSLPLSVNVQDAPAAPVLTLDPHRELYLAGDSVQLLCSVPSAPTFYVREIQFYGNGVLAVSIPVWDARNYSYPLNVTGEEQSGYYSCAYFIFWAGRTIRSQESPGILVDIKSHKTSWIREIAVGGSFFTINGLIFLFSHCLMKTRELEEGLGME